MTTYLITMLVFAVIGVGVTTHHLQGAYPRQRTSGRSEDLITLCFQVGMLVWIINLLLEQAA
ncbi:hypothetical protein [Stutzerimonas nitrititolerans]|uniref:hypothetical protein n=1 Tax=Stutzerimonas nitrititolerans TaxID=2482751 RepID=UPI0028AF0A02|nr:hypothetical protein [Stutzerimonas nitrititolerans]